MSNWIVKLLSHIVKCNCVLCRYFLMIPISYGLILNKMHKPALFLYDISVSTVQTYTLLYTVYGILIARDGTGFTNTHLQVVWQQIIQCHCNTVKKETRLSLALCICFLYYRMYLYTVYSLYNVKCKWTTLYETLQ